MPDTKSEALIVKGADLIPLSALLNLPSGFYGGRWLDGDALIALVEECVRMTPPQAAVQAEPVLYVSPEQLNAHTDPKHPYGGRYLPSRKTPKGKFTQPLFTAPQAQPADALDAADAVGFSPMYLAPLDGTPVLLYLPTTIDRFAIGQWHGHPDCIEGCWGDDEGNFYTHTPTGFMSLRYLSSLAERKMAADIRAAQAAAQEGDQS